MTTQIADLIGLTEIAERYGVSKNTANGWVRKDNFPAPKHTLRMGPMWDKNEIDRYLQRPVTYEQQLEVLCGWCGGAEMYGFQIQTEVNTNWPRVLARCAACNNRSLVDLHVEGTSCANTLRITVSKESQ